MKYLLTLNLILVGLLGYSAVRFSAFNVDVAEYTVFQTAEMDYRESVAHAHLCELVWKLRKKQSLPLFTNCWTDKGEFFPDGWENMKFGSTMMDGEKAYHKRNNAVYKYEYVAKNRTKLGIYSLLRMTPPKVRLLTFDSNFYRNCTFKGKPITVFHKYEYGMHTDQGSIYVPEAFGIINCKEVKD